LADGPGDNRLWVKVREVIRLIEDAGWYLVRMKGSHLQFRHSFRTGGVTVSGHRNDDLAPGTLRSILKQAGLKVKSMSRYLIVIENTGRNYSAYSPDLPGCAATGSTIEETRKNMEGAVEFHVEGLREDGIPIPPPSSIADYVEIP
jgi:predicted RNA binding protein YcfA (HicA-like mRNA interferase family)/predicted RNase H-like HicB family nuclease